MNILLNCLPTDEAGTFDPLFTPVLDRPFLQGVIEHLVQHGAASIDVMAAPGDTRVMTLLADGTRWGCAIRIHQTAAALPVAIREVVERADLDGPLLLASGRTLPIVDLRQHTPTPRQQAPVVFVDAAEGLWTGWAWMPLHAISATARLGTMAGFMKRLRSWAGASGTSVRVTHVLSVATPEHLLAAHVAVLSDVCPGWQRAAREVTPGVWLSRNAVLHPDTHVIAPVFLGEGAHVEAGTFGPFAVAANASVVDHTKRVSHAVLCGHTYLGPDLSLTDAVASGRTLWSVRHDATIDVGDSTFLHALNLESASGGWLDRWLTRLRVPPAGGASQTAPVPAD